MNPKCLIVKVLAQRAFSDRSDVLIGQICLVSHHLESLLGAIELTILCAFICIVGYFDAQLRETVVYK